jgi:uncharacterized protein (DUF427 family)
MGALDELRHEPTEKRVRARLGKQDIVDSTQAVLVWEPRRVVPSYAVPPADVRGEFVPIAPAPSSDAPILHPGISFSAHSTDGESLALKLGDETLDHAAFRPADGDLAGHVVLDHDAFDSWFEEDEPILGHPRDPFHRVDTRKSFRQVRVEYDGQVLAESSEPTFVFETNLPLRFYLPRRDLQAEPRPSARRTVCAYKGEASYLSFDLGGKAADVAWTYEDPLPDARPLAGLVAFYDELVDVIVDGERRPRPDTPFARALADEFGL